MRQSTYIRKYEAYLDLCDRFGKNSTEARTARKVLERAWVVMATRYVEKTENTTDIVVQVDCSLNPKGTVNITAYYDTFGYSDPGTFFQSRSTHKSYIYDNRKMRKLALYTP
jgi:hypothetical protein